MFIITLHHDYTILNCIESINLLFHRINEADLANCPTRFVSTCYYACIRIHLDVAYWVPS